MFGNMVTDLAAEAFKDEDFYALTEEQFQLFLKEATFELLKGEHLGSLFAERFGINDRVLRMYSDEQHVIQHIRYCKYVK